MPRSWANSADAAGNTPWIVEKPGRHAYYEQRIEALLPRLPPKGRANP
jgi:hypothetical protein